MYPSAPTWRNGHSGAAGISKRLDRFLLSESLLPCVSFYRTWATPLDVSNHYPICLEWGPKSYAPCRPFKFNRAWILEEDFAHLVLSSWKAPLNLIDYCHMDVLTFKLRRLKGFVKDWERANNIERKQQLLDINDGISDLLLEDSGILSAPNVEKWKNLQERKGKYWAHEITTQRLKSRVLWLKEGDANTIFFHSFTFARRNTNTIWSLNDQEGNSISEDKALKLLGKKHFSDLFSDDKS